MRCRIGFHDYKILKSVPKYKLVQEIEELHFKQKNIYIGDYLPLNEFDVILYYKICNRCNTVVNEINDFVIEYIDNKKEKYKTDKIVSSMTNHKLSNASK